MYSRLSLLLSRDRVAIASSLFNLTLEEAMALRDITDHACNFRLSMDVVFQLMSERRVTLGELVQVLREMQRFDAISVLTEAGYPEYTSGNMNQNVTKLAFAVRMIVLSPTRQVYRQSILGDT